MEIDRIARDPKVVRARKLLRRTDAATLDDQLRVVRIPAPPFGEARRAAWLASRFREIGLAGVQIDDVGNGIGRLAAAGAVADDRRVAANGAEGANGVDEADGAEHADGAVVLAAHLDTVFADRTEIRPRREGDRWIAPGIADNARGLAVLLAVARSLVAARVDVVRPLVFVGTVGEEGEGDLRGVKHLFRRGGALRGAGEFIALDGAGCDRVVHAAVGARRLRFTVTGPGGHSWTDSDRPNPIHALGRAVAELADLEPAGSPRSTLCVGRVRGGTRVNSIPEEAWCEVDLRGLDAGALEALAARIGERIASACRRECARAGARTRGGGGGGGKHRLRLETRTIGDRPPGETPSDAPLVRAAREATRQVGGRADLAIASTDANVPIALGVPAIALGGGGEAGEIHTRHEWYANVRGVEGAERALLVALAAAGLGSG